MYFSATLHLHAGKQQRRALREGASCQIPVSRMKILKLQRTGGIATSRVASDARVPPPVCTAPSRSLFLVRARGSCEAHLPLPPQPHLCFFSFFPLGNKGCLLSFAQNLHLFSLTWSGRTCCSCQYHHHFTSPLFLPLRPLWTDSSTHKFDTSIFRGPACKKSQSKHTSVGVGWC